MWKWIVVLLAISSCFGRIPTFMKPKRVLDVTKLEDTVCPFQPIAVPLPSPISATITNAFQKVAETFSQMLPNTTAPGLFATAVYRDQIIWQFGTGSKDLNTPGVPPDLNTIFRIGSVSKLFPVLFAYQLVEEGLISLDDQLSQYSDFFINNPYTSSGITFRQVASQLGGLPREAPCVIPCNVTTEDIFNILKTQTLILPPIVRPSYSNLGFSLIGRILEGLVDDVFEDYVIENILKPLNMTSTGFAFTSDVVNQMAVGYEPDGSVAPLFDFGWNAPCGQMYSNGNDLSKLMVTFLQSYLSQDSPILQSNSLKEMLSPFFLNPDGQTLFGTPWEIEFQNNYLVRRKGGNVDGYSALLSVVPELQLGVSVLWNGQADEFSFSNAAYDILIPAFVNTLTPIQPPIPQPSNTTFFTGQYALNGDQSFVATVTTYQGTLLLRIPEIMSVYLKWDHDETFRVYIPPNALSCLEGELLAFLDEFVIFAQDASSFSIPGLLYGSQFTKMI